MAIKKKSKQKARDRNLKASRRAAGVNVVISIVAATALLVVANIISDSKNYQRDVETLGRYGMSDAAEKILRRMDQPIRLTSIYTSTKPDKKPQEYLPRLRDLMEEITRRKDNVVVVNVTSDRQKAEVLARLRGRLDEAAADHSKVVKDFQILADAQSQQYEEIVRQCGMAALDHPASDVREALGELGASATVLVLPQGGSILPRVHGRIMMPLA